MLIKVEIVNKEEIIENAICTAQANCRDAEYARKQLELVLRSLYHSDIAWDCTQRAMDAIDRILSR